MRQPGPTMPRYPDIHVRLTSRHPLVAVSAIRHALRRAGVDRGEVLRFTEEALDDIHPTSEVCRRWASIEFA